MADFGTTFERLELKYLITEVEADAIREYVTAWCEPDAHNQGQSGYRIENIYLDSPDNETFRAWIRADYDRFKLRIRTYGPGTPAWLEVKRKTAGFIRKVRCNVARDDLQNAVSGFARPLSGRREDQRILDQFAYFAARIGAEPRLLVRYQREAWASTVDRYARVTFDRRIEAQPADSLSFEPPTHGRWSPLDAAFRLDGLQSPLVLELKCERRLPLWMVELMQRFQLDLRGYSKYCYGMEASLMEGQIGSDPRLLQGAAYV